MSPDGRVNALTEERDFFLRSLRDLETERQAGDIDEVDYRALKDDYTARAAVTIRRLDELDRDAGDDGPAAIDGEVSAPEASGEVSADTSRRRRRRRPWTWWQKGIAVVIVALLGATGGWLVSHRSGSSGGTSRLSGAQVTTLLRQAAAVAGHNPVTALNDYRRILVAYPEQPQALAEEGWLLAQGGELGAGEADLRLAEQVDPSWDLPHGYRGMVLFGEKDYAGAASELGYYLGHGPDAALAGQAQAALASAQKDVAATGGG